MISTLSWEKNVQILLSTKCSNVSIHKMYKCFYPQNVQLFPFTKCTNVSIHDMYKCLNIQYCKFFLFQNVFFLHNFGLRAGSVHTWSKRMVGYRAEQFPRKKANWILLSTQTQNNYNIQFIKCTNHMQNFLFFTK